MNDNQEFKEKLSSPSSTLKLIFSANTMSSISPSSIESVSISTQNPLGLSNNESIKLNESPPLPISEQISTYFLNKQYSEAIELLDKSLQESLFDYNLLKLASSQRDLVLQLEKGKLPVKQLVLLISDNDLFKSRLIEAEAISQSHTLIENKQEVEAIQILESISQWNVNAAFRLSEVYGLQGDIVNERAYLRKCLQLFPEHERSSKRLIELRSQQNKKHIKIEKQCAELGNQSQEQDQIISDENYLMQSWIKSSLIEGKIYSKLEKLSFEEDVDSAILNMEQYLLSSPKNKYAILTLTKLYEISHELLKAQSLINNHSHLFLENEDAHELYGRIELKLNNPQSSIDTFIKYESNENFKLYLAVAYWELSNQESANKYMEQFLTIQLNKDVISIQKLVCLLLKDLMKVETSEKILIDEVEQLAKQSSDIMNKLGPNNQNMFGNKLLSIMRCLLQSNHHRFVSTNELNLLEIVPTLEINSNNISCWGYCHFIESQKWQKGENLLKEIELLEECVKMQPNSFPFCFKLAQCLVQSDKCEKAMQILMKLNEKYNKNEEILLLLSEVYFKLKNIKKSVDYINKLLEITPNNEQALIQKGVYSLHLFNTKVAEQCFRQCIEINPLNQVAHIKLAEFYVEQQFYQQAADQLEKLIEFHPNNSAYYFQFGNLELGTEEFKIKKLNALIKCTELDANNQQAFYLVGEIYLSQNKKEQAQLFFSKQIKNNPQHINSYIKLFELLKSSDLTEEAIDLLYQCLHHNPQQEYVIILLRDLLIEKNETKKLESLNYYRSKLISKVFSNSENIKLAMENLNKGAKSKSNSYFKKAIDENPFNATLKYEISCIFFQHNSHQQAASILKEAIKQVPQFTHCRFRLAQFYMSTSQQDLAKEELETLLNYQPFHPAALCELGKIELSKKNYQVALKHLKKSMKSCQNCLGIYGALGIVYWKLGKIRYAFEHLLISKHLKETQWDDTIDFLLGKCELIDNNPQKAEENFVRMQGKISKSEKSKVQCYIGLCNYQLGKQYLTFFEESTLKKCKNRIKLISLKLILSQYISALDVKSLIRVRSQHKNSIAQFQDPDLYALLAEADIICGNHLYLAMEHVEKGLGELKFQVGFKEGVNFEEINSQIKQENQSKSPHLFGCQIRYAQILLLLGEKDKALQCIQEVISNMEKKEKTNQQTIDIEVRTKEQKNQQKENWIILDWKPKAEMLLAEILIELRSFEKGSQVLANILKSPFQTIQKTNTIYYLEAQIPHKKGQLEQCLKQLASIKQFDKSEYQISVINKEQGKTQESRVHLQQALLLSAENNYRYIHLLAILEFEDQKYQKSIDLFEKYMLLLNSQNKNLLEYGTKQRQILISYDTLSKQAKGQYELKKYKQSMELYKESLSQEPNQADALQILGIIQIKLDNHIEAEKVLVQSSELEEQAETFYQLGKCRLHFKDNLMARQYLNKADSLDPKHFQTIQSLGDLSLDEEKFLMAREYFKRGFQINRSDEVILIGLAKCIWKIDNDQNDAEKQFLQCIKQNSSSLNIFQEIINFYKEIKKLPEKVFLDKYKSIFNTHVPILLQLGDLFFQAAANNPQYYSDSEEFLLILIGLPNSINFDKYLSFTYLLLAQIEFYKQNFKSSTSYLTKSRSFSKKVAQNKASKSIEFLHPVCKYEEIPMKEQYDFKMLKARILLIQNEDASKQIMKCIKLDPTNFLSYSSMAFFLLYKNSKQAWKFHQKAIDCIGKQEISQKVVEQIMILNALSAVEKNENITAKQILCEYLNLQKDNLGCLFYLGQIYMKENNFEEASKIFTKCFQAHNNTLQKFNSYALTNEQREITLCQLATSLTAQGLRAKGLLTIQKCIDLYPNNAKALMIRSRILLEEGEISKALESAQSSLKADPDAAMTHYLLALAQLRSVNIISAITSLKKCFQIDNQFPDIQLKLALVYQKICRPQVALSHFLQHLGYFPNSKFALLNSSKLLSYFGKHQEAHSHLNRLFQVLKDTEQFTEKKEVIINKSDPFKINPELEIELAVNETQINLPCAYAVQGYIYKNQGDYHSAVVACQASLGIINNEDVLEHLADSYSLLGNYEHSINEYKMLLKHKNSKQKSEQKLDLQRILNNLGNSLLSNNQIKEAFGVYSKALLASKEEQLEILANLSYCNILQGQYDKAFSHLETAIKNDKYHYPSIHLIGVIHEKKGDLVYAQKFYEKVIKMNNYYPSYLCLARLQLRTQKPSESIKVCQDFLKQNGQNIHIQLQLGEGLIQNKDFLIALTLFQETIATINIAQATPQQKKQYTLCNIQISRIYTSLLQFDQAIFHLQQSLIQFPENHQYLNELGCIFLNYYNHENEDDKEKKNRYLIESANLLRFAVKLQPKNGVYTFNLAGVLNKLKKHEEEIEFLLNCLNLTIPFKDKVFNNLGLAYSAIYQKETAKKYLKKSINANPNVFEPHFNLANLFLSIKNFSSAVSSYKACLGIDKDHIGALNNYALASLQLKDYETVGTCYYKIIKMEPTLRSLYQPKLIILIKRGHFQSENKDDFIH